MSKQGNEKTIKPVKPIVLAPRKKSAKAGRLERYDTTVFNETLKSVNQNITLLSSQFERVHTNITRVDERVAKLEDKFDDKLTAINTQLNANHEKINMELSNIKVLNGRTEPIVNELKRTVMDKDGLKDRINKREQEKIIGAFK